ncbi:SPOR domain-containing protein [Candidatus Desantisbacteria bacterium]|nr:SPOR domain-containing protein [Candidatus Desantisbacteria bacterium]
MMKKRPTNRENSIIIGTILASGIVFIFGFFLGRAWVTIPQEQADTYQKSSGTPAVLTEEKPETPMLPKKRLLKKSVIKEKSIPEEQPQIHEEIPQENLIPYLVKKTVQKPVVTQSKQQAAARMPAAPPQKQQMVVQKPAAQKSAMPQLAQKPVPTQPKQQAAVRMPVAPPQKQQMVVQKIAVQKPAISQTAQKPVGTQSKQQVAAKTPAIPPQKQQMVVQKPAVQKPAIPQTAQKPVVTQPKQEAVAKTPATSPQKQQEAVEKVETTQKKTEGRFVLQLGSFSDEAKASALVSSLSAKGCSAYSSKMEMGEKGTWYRVYLSGIFKSREDAQQKGDGLKSQGVVGNYFIISSR